MTLDLKILNLSTSDVQARVARKGVAVDTVYDVSAGSTFNLQLDNVEKAYVWARDGSMCEHVTVAIHPSGRYEASIDATNGICGSVAVETTSDKLECGTLATTPRSVVVPSDLYSSFNCNYVSNVACLVPPGKTVTKEIIDCCHRSVQSVSFARDGYCWALSKMKCSASCWKYQNSKRVLSNKFSLTFGEMAPSDFNLFNTYLQSNGDVKKDANNGKCADVQRFGGLTTCTYNLSDATKVLIEALPYVIILILVCVTVVFR